MVLRRWGSGTRRSDEGLTLETSAFQSLYGGQFTLSTPLINQIFNNIIALFVALTVAVL